LGHEASRRTGPDKIGTRCWDRMQFASSLSKTCINESWKPASPNFTEIIVRTQKAYYVVFASRDGTIYLVNETRKPRKTKYSPRPKIDEDGICTLYVEKDVQVKDLPDWMKSVWHTALATTLNAKRILRQQIEPRLDRIERTLQTIQERIGTLEQKIDRLIAKREAD